MAELADKFPRYGWERNAGYGTVEHKAALTHWALRISTGKATRRSARC